MTKQTISLPEGILYQSRTKISADEYWLQLIHKALSAKPSDLPLETGLVFQDLARKKQSLVNQYRVEHKKFSRAKVFIRYSPSLLPQSKSEREIFLGRLDSLSCCTKYLESLSSQREPFLTLHVLLDYRGSQRSSTAITVEDLLNNEVKRKLSKEFEASFLSFPLSISLSSPSSLSSLSYSEALKEIPNLPSSLQEEVNAMLEVNTSDREDNRPLTFPEEEIIEVIRNGLKPEKSV